MKKSLPADEVADLLVKLGVVQTDELDALPGLRASLADRDEALKLAAGVRQRLGELLTDASRLIDVRLGYLTLAERDIIVEFQRHQGGEVPTSGKLRLGQILVSTGEISESVLTEALEHARDTGRKIGEELVAEGYLSKDRLDRALALQRRLVNAACVAALVSAGATYTTQVKAGQARAFMAVTATVVDTVSMRAVYQAQDLVITANDVARGYVEVPAASRFEIANKGPCLFEFRPAGDIFRSFRVMLPEGTAQFGAAGGTMLQKSGGTGIARIDIGYRFELASNARPGAYRWPLSLTVLPM